MEMENKYANKGVAGTALGLGIGALGVEALRGGLGGIFGGGCANEVSHYQARIAELESEVKLRDANIYSDSKLLEVYKYFDGENKAIRAELSTQAVKNAQIEGAFAVLGEKMTAQRNEFLCALSKEKEERCCGDNAIVNYANATFYPKLVADVTAATTTTAQAVYNPIPNCGCCK
jgi:hypothetical protein